MAGGAETPNFAALPAIARLGTCESARGPDADRHVKLLSQFAVEGSLSGAYSHKDRPQPIANFCSLFKQYERGLYRHRYLSSGTEIAKPFSVIEMKQ